MASDTELSRLLLLLYEGVSTPGGMQLFLHALVETVEGKGAVLREHSYTAEGKACIKASNLSETVGYSDESLLTYGSYFCEKDVYLQRVLERFPAADCGVSQTLISQSDLMRTEIFCDYQVPNDVGPMMWAKLAAQPGYHSSLSIVRRNKAPGFDCSELALVNSLTPHLRQALQLNKTLHALQSSNAMLSRSLEETGVAICMVRQDGSVLRTTEGAERLLEKRDGIWLQNGRLTTAARPEQVALDRLIAAAAQTGAGNGSAHAMRTQSRAAGDHPICTWTAGAGGALLLSRNPPLRSLHVMVSPFCPGSLLNEAEATALIHFTDPAATAKPRAAVLRALYGLTPVEGRIADLILQGLEVREAADRLGNTLHTARFHLKQVFVKTGTHRQSELVRLMLSLPGER